jgi:diguanylate cyclase (GGDEF)-like protein
MGRVAPGADRGSAVAGAPDAASGSTRTTWAIAVQKPAIPEDETLRLRALQTAQVLDTPADERLDSITRLAQKLFNVPIALVSLVDANRQWFKSRQGLDATETPRDVSFCGHAILRDELFVIEDALRDPRFADNPLVVGEPGVRFYAGAPLRMRSGHRVGTLCIIDRKPRRFTDHDREVLAELGRLAEQQLRAIALAATDELTQISNRRGVVTLGRNMLARCHRAGSSLGLALFDLNDFKRINDTLGHDEGDRALVDFARCLLLTFRESDAVGRLGGDEFCALLPDADGASAARALARLDEHVAAANAARPQAAQLVYSVGVAFHHPAEPPDLDRLMAAADEKMYEAKRLRRGASRAR